MKRRLFALLLAVVMVLGLSVPVLGEGEADPAGEVTVSTETEEIAGAAEKTADLSEEAPGTTEELTESAEEPTESAEEPTESAEEPAGSTEEPTGAAEEPGEPAPIQVNITGEAEALVLRQVDGTLFQSGDKVPYDAQNGCYTLRVDSRATHYYVWGPENEQDTVDDETSYLYITDDGDGVVDVVVKEEDHVPVTLVNEPGVALKLTQMDGTEFQSGDKVYADTEGFMLQVEGLPAHFTLRDASGNNNAWYDSKTGLLYLTFTEQTQADGVTVEVAEDQYIQVTLVNEPGVALELTQMDGTEFQSGDKVYADTEGFMLQVEGLPEHFTIQDASGEGAAWIDEETGLLQFSWFDEDFCSITIEVVEDPYVMVDLTDNSGLGLTVTQTDGRPFHSGDKVYFAGQPDDSYRPALVVKKGSEIVKGLRFASYSESEDETLFADYDAESGFVFLFDNNGDDYISVTIDVAPSFQIKLAGETDKLKSLTYQGKPVKDGDTIYSYYSEQEYGAASLDAEFVAGYGIERNDYYGAGHDYADSYFLVDDVYAFVNAEDGDGDGVVTLTVAKRPTVKLTITGAADKVEFADPHGDPVKSGDVIYADGYLYVEIASGYGILTSDFYSIDEGMFFVDAFDRSEIVVRVMPCVTLNLTGEGVLGVESYSYGSEIKNGEQVLTGERYSVSVKGGYTIEVTGGSVKQDQFNLDGHTGEITCWYVLTPDGSGPVTVKGVASSEQGPAVFRIKYVDADGAIDNEGIEYCMADWGYMLYVKEGYTLSVEGGTASPQGSGDEDENGTVWVPFVVITDENAAGLTVTSVKLKDGAVLKVNGSKDALLEKDPYDSGDVFCTDGDKLPNGRDYVLVKSGYAITDVQGGKAETYQLYYNDPGKSEIYTLYYVEATADTVTLTVSPVAPNRWVKVNMVNNYDDDIESGIYCGTDQEGNSWCPVSPNNPDGFDLAANLFPRGGDIELADYTIVGQGCSVTWLDGYDSWVQYGVKVDDGVGEITITVVKKDLQPELEVKVPDKPAAGVPGVPDKAAAEKKLMEKASAVVDAALQGQTPAGVSKADAAAIAKAAAEGKTITTQLVARAVTAPADAAVLKTAAGEDVIVQYVDIQIVVLADGEQIGHITETDQTLDFAVVLSDEELAKGVIFYVIRSHDSKTSELDARLEGNVLSFSSDKFSTFAVVGTSDISFADVEAIADKTWTGSEIKPAVKVTANGSRTLTEGVDYTVSYKNNVGTGTATVVITGIGTYTGTKEVTFRIVVPATTAKPAGTTAPGTAPATGDETPLALYAGLLALSAAGLVLVLGRKKRTEK